MLLQQQCRADGELARRHHLCPLLARLPLAQARCACAPAAALPAAPALPPGVPPTTFRCPATVSAAAAGQQLACGLQRATRWQLRAARWPPQQAPARPWRQVGAAPRRRPKGWRRSALPRVPPPQALRRHAGAAACWRGGWVAWVRPCRCVRRASRHSTATGAARAAGWGARPCPSQRRSSFLTVGLGRVSGAACGWAA